MDAASAVTVLGAAGIAAAATGVLLTRSPSGAVVATGISLVLWPLTLSPLPATLPLAFWLVSVLLGTFILYATVRGQPAPLAPLPLGGAPEAGFVVLGLALGWVVAPVAGAGRGTEAALAAAAATGFAALPLAGFSRDALRTGLGAVLSLEAGTLLVAALAGTPTSAGVLAFALAELGVAAAARGVLVADRAARGIVASASFHTRGAPAQGVDPAPGRVALATDARDTGHRAGTSPAASPPVPEPSADGRA